MEELKIEKNYHNGGLCCVFTHGGQEYFADLCVLPFVHQRIFHRVTECMIFKIVDGQVTLSNASPLYCKHDIDVTEENLRACITEFIESLK